MTTPRAVIVHRASELTELLARHGTRGQVSFFLDQRGQSLAAVEERHERTRAALADVSAGLPVDWRRATVERSDLARFVFEPDDVVLVVGQDGLVANAAKYLGIQPVIGIDPLVLRERADEVKAVMRANASMRGVNDNWNESVKVMRLEVDQSKARALGVTSQSIAQGARTLLSGTPVGQFREGDKLIDIVLRQPLDERNAITDIGNAYLPTASGQSIPLTQIAKPVFAWEPGVMWRENRDYAITVQGDIAEGLQGATVTNQLQPGLKELEAKWHGSGMSGYRIEVAGAVEESSKGSASIAAGIPIMLFLTFTLLMLQLHSFSRAMLVFLTGPLGIAGVAGALILLGRPFGFVALLGVIALMGMIQRNSVILIDQIELDRARGVPAWDAIVESAVRRLRPIVLTAAAAVLAMIPLSRSVFWGPMAVAIMGGLIVATVLTLLALPAMYAAWFRVRREDSAVPVQA